jgi:NADH:ubiquinone oxidoreductase subunit 5 (subunit L)/multisubunit Na+/H+ antiporter MnhA subunit
MFSQIMLLVTVLAPTLGAFALPLLGRASLRARNAVAFGLVAAALAGTACLIPSAATGHVTTVRLEGPPGLAFVLQADGLAVFMALVSSLVSAVIVLYSTDYISHYGNQNEYYLMVVLFLGAMMGLVFSGNLILLYVFWEITAIASWRLIGFFREKYHVVRADKAFLVTVFGALAMLLGFITLYAQTGSFDLAVIKNGLKGSHLGNFAAAMILLGILSKSATLPFHTWLPDAGVAPSPVTALLHAAVLVKIGVYVYARLFIVTFSPSPQMQEVVLIVAAASAIVSAGAALIETDLKRIIAYSTVSQIAFIFLGLATGNEMGLVGALLYILMHGLAKGGLFLCAGIVEQGTGTKDITRLGGLLATMPVTATSFLLCAVSVMGVPPLGGFFSKYMVFSGAIQGGHGWIAAVFLAGAFLTILYLFRLFNAIFLSSPRMVPAGEGSRLMVACVALLAGLSLACGLWIAPSSQLAQAAVRQMLGATP